jgi:hypothetical protein
MFDLRPVVTFTRATPTAKVISFGVKLHDPRGRVTTQRNGRVLGGTQFVFTETARTLKDPDVVLGVNSQPCDFSNEHVVG